MSPIYQVFVTEVIGSEELCVFTTGPFIFRIDKIKPKYENREIFKSDTRNHERRGNGYFFLMAFLLEKAAFLVVVYLHLVRNRNTISSATLVRVNTSNPILQACMRCLHLIMKSKTTERKGIEYFHNLPWLIQLTYFPKLFKE